jgi:flagellar M-ring protein FliF
MEQLKQLLRSLSMRQRIVIVLAAILVAGGLYAFSRWNRERDFRPLYTGLSLEDGGAVVQKLHESGVEFRLSENGTTVLVPSARVAELRLQMASAGLPRSGRIGFELFDKTNFGVTDFTEQVNYRRALEGELERSVMSLSEVEQARVHITFSKESVFLDSRQPAKASVLVRLRPSMKLAPGNVLAVTQLVSSAVEGLAPEAVAVLDMQGNLLSRRRMAGLTGGPEPSEAMLDYRQSIEKDLVAKMNSTLEPFLGAERFRTGASVDCDFTSGEQSEETFDPARTVMVTSQRTEDATGGAVAAGVPGTASNLPRPTSRPGSSSTGVSRRSENISYQASRSTRHIRLPLGTLKRLSLAVLVDNTIRWEGTGPKARRILEPASPQKLKAARDLVAAATGFSAERGDQLIVETQPFESTLSLEPPPGQPEAPPGSTGFQLPVWMQMGGKYKNLPVLIGAAVGVLLLLLALAAVWMVRRGRLRKQKTAEVNVQPTLPGSTSDPGAAANAEGAETSPEDPEKVLEKQLADRATAKARLDAQALNSLKLPPVTTKKAEVLTKHINEETKKNPVTAAQLIRTWLNEREQR